MADVREFIFAKYDFELTSQSAGKRVELAQTAPPMGVLFVKAVRAANLKNRDSGINGDVSDPFLQVQLGSATAKTAWIKDTLNPEWNAALDALQWNGLDLLKLEVWDFDKMTGNDSLGQAIVNLEGVPDSGEAEARAQTVTVALHGPHALPDSTLTVSLSFQDLHQW